MPEPERLRGPEGRDWLEGIGTWYWMVAGRLFVCSFRVLSIDSPQERAAEELKAWRDLVAYVDGLLPERHEPPDPGMSEKDTVVQCLGFMDDPTATPREGPCQIADGGTLPLPAQ
jgi:hypothetical protein